MRSASNLRVLMLGWEYPPRFAGGLGKACQGLSQAMAKQGAQVFFVLPTFPERVSEPHLEVVGARECLLEAGWDPNFEEVIAENIQARAAAPGTAEWEAMVTVIRSDARLYPYGVAPQGEISKRLERMMKQQEAEGAAHAGPAEKVRRALRRMRARRALISGRAAAAAAKPSSGTTEIYGKNMWSEIERFAYTVRHLAETHEVDCVHAHDWMTFPAAFEFQRMTGVPVFLHVHATEYDRTGENLNNEIFRIERDGFRRATHIFAVSRYTAGIIQRLYGVHRKKISVCYNAPEENARTLIASPDAPRRPQVIFLGRLTFQKGPDHFLRAAELVSRANREARFIFCGTGDMMNKLVEQAGRMGISDRVNFAGFVDPAGVDQVLQHSKVLVMPSVSEPFGLVALEAIRCGIPVIISKQSGVKEVLPRALQVDFWDHEKLADQILAALRLPDLSRQLVSEGIELIQLLSWDKSAHKVIEVYHQHLGSTYAQAIGGAHGH